MDVPMDPLMGFERRTVFDELFDVSFSLSFPAGITGEYVVNKAVETPQSNLIALPVRSRAIRR